MRTFFSAIFILCLSAAISNPLSAQSQFLDHVVGERISKLENICGSWVCTDDDADASIYLEMEDKSSAIGELYKGDMVYFLHCFTDDMDKHDAYTAGAEGQYEYCILQQSSGETVGIFYLVLDGELLKGVFVSDSLEENVTFSRVGKGQTLQAPVNMAEVEDDTWSNVRYLDSKEAYEAYLKEFPEGKYADEARKILDTIDDTHLWEETIERGTYEAYEAYLDSPVYPKLHENDAKGTLAYLDAVAADNIGDVEAVLKHLDVMDKTLGLTLDAFRMRERNLEIQSYRKYLASATDEEAITNGIEYVNTFLNGEHRSEVSDRVAYLMASSPAYLAGTFKEVILTYAVTEETIEYVNEQTKKAAKARSKKSSLISSNIGFNGGIGGSIEAAVPGFDMIYGGHALFSIGDNRNFFNFEFGIMYRYWQFKELTPEIGNVDFHHIRLVAAPKFNLIRQKKSAFYLYIAPEAGYGYPIDMHATGLYMPNSISFGGRVGIGIGRFDLSAMATYDFIPMVNEKFPAGRYSQQQVGVALTFYISGSGRN